MSNGAEEIKPSLTGLMMISVSSGRVSVKKTILNLNIKYQKKI